jgi:hypothetical protein
MGPRGPRVRKIGHLGGVVRSASSYKPDAAPSVTAHPTGGGDFGGRRRTNQDFYRGVRYDLLSDSERANRESQVMNSMGIFAPLAIPGIAVIRATTALGDALGGRKNTVTRPTTPKKSGRGR